MILSIGICTHNEGDYIRQLLNKLVEFIQFDRSGVVYEIVIIDDFSTDLETVSILKEYIEKYPFIIRLYEHALNGNYSEHKNFLNSKCSGDWILNLDADEWITEDFLGYVPAVIDANPEIQAFWVPRINTVEGLTLKHLQKWGWVLTKFDSMRKIRVINSTSDEYKLLKDFGYIISDENGVVVYYEPIVCWPDFQMRLYRNIPEIHWENKVHEKLTGFEKFGILPQEEVLAIRHYKDITRQEKQNAYYETLQR